MLNSVWICSGGLNLLKNGMERVFSYLPVADLLVTSDAAGSMGYGALYRQQWFNQLRMQAQRTLSIAYKEMFPVVIVAHLWGDQWANRRFCFRSDYSAVHILSARTCRNHHIMVLIRSLLGVAANFTFEALHVPRC